jgi:hypothetical protein
MGIWLAELGTCYPVMMPFFRPRSGARSETLTQRRFNRPASVRNARASNRLVGQPSTSGPVRRGPQCERRLDQRHAWRTHSWRGGPHPLLERTQLALFSVLLASAVCDRRTHRGGAGTCSAEARPGAGADERSGHQYPAIEGRRAVTVSLLIIGLASAVLYFVALAVPP